MLHPELVLAHVLFIFLIGVRVFLIALPLKEHIKLKEAVYHSNNEEKECQQLHNTEEVIVGKYALALHVQVEEKEAVPAVDPLAPENKSCGAIRVINAVVLTFAHTNKV